jgi:hypothetical protein
MNKKSGLSKRSKKSKNKDKQVTASDQLQGWPGFRTRAGRSGYDPIDTDTEAAHTAGTIVHKLFVGRVQNPVFLFLLGVVGLVVVTPLVLAIIEVLNGNVLPLGAWIYLLITGIPGLFILVNFIRNLVRFLSRK